MTPKLLIYLNKIIHYRIDLGDPNRSLIINNFFKTLKLIINKIIRIELGDPSGSAERQKKGKYESKSLVIDFINQLGYIAVSSFGLNCYTSQSWTPFVRPFFLA